MGIKNILLVLLGIVMISCFIMSGFFFLKSGLFSFDDGDIDDEAVKDAQNFLARTINVFIEGKDLESFSIQSTKNISLDGISKIKIYTSNLNISVAGTDVALLKMNANYLGTGSGKQPELAIRKAGESLSVKTIIPKCWLINDIGVTDLNLSIAIPEEYNGSIIVYAEKNVERNGFESINVRSYSLCSLT